jgi:hypothetical protein
MALINDFTEWVVAQMSGYNYIGVGDSNTAESPSQTGLLGSNTHYEQAESGYPSISGNQITNKIIVASSEAQFPWQEFVICDGTPGNVANRVVIPVGTKGNVEWEFDLTLTITVA